MNLLPQRARSSLRLRLLLATVALVAVALLVAAVAFERVARGVVMEAVHSHLRSRAQEVQDSVERFQRERALTVGNWSDAEAMQLTIDSGDGKFAEDYLRRTIQDQNGAFTAVALLSTDGEILAAVRDGTARRRLGMGLPELRQLVVELGAVEAAREADAIRLGFSPLSALLKGAVDDDVLIIAAPVKDFAGDLVGFVAGALSPRALPALLADVVGAGSPLVPIVTDAGQHVIVAPTDVDARPLRPALAIAQGAAGTLASVEDGVEEPLLVVRTAASAAAPGWATWMTTPESAALGRLRQLHTLLAALFVVVLVVAGVAAIGAVRHASRPLADVSTSMAKVAGGDLTTRLAETYTDELGHLVKSFNVMVKEVARSRDELKRTEALRREVQLAHQIQTAILPVSFSLEGFDVAARMKPADDVGGDLYDILPFDDTFWLVVGDVSGHGINSGLVMMMAQAAAYGAIADDPRCSPGHVIAAVNRVVHENVKKRMRRDDYLTLMAARHVGGGRFVAAGAHQPIFISRPGGHVDVVETPGAWVGLAADVPLGVSEYEFRVGPGDALCLITDGVVEATDAHGELYGEERLRRVLGADAGRTAPELLGDVFAGVEAFAVNQSDDMTAVVLRRAHAS
jgi:sigma-B regulation protein RsbU (phosphoserine phosphatase)